MKFFLAIIILFFAAQATAQSVAVDLQNYATIHSYTYSKPTEAAQWAHGLIKNLDPERDPIPWMRAYWIMSVAADFTFNRQLIEVYDKEETLLSKAIAIAKSQKLPAEYLQLRSLQILHEHGHTPELTTAAAVLLKEPFTQNSEGAEAFLYAEVAWSHYARDEFQETFKSLETAFRLTTSNRSVLRADRIRVLNDIGLLLAATGQLQRGIDVLLEASKDCEKDVLHYLCGVVTYNLGEQYLRLGDAFQAEAVSTFHRSIKLAEAGGDRATMGTAYNGLAESSFKSRVHLESLDFATRAVELLQQTSDKEWLARSLVTRVDPLLALKRWPAAEADLARAESLSGDEAFLGNLINQRKARLFAAQGDWEKSSHLWSQVFDYTIKTNKEKDQKKLAQATAALGLVTEEQKNLRLQEEVKRQEQQLLLSFGILILASIALVFALFSLRKSREIKRSREKLQRILDNIDEGLLTIDADLTVEHDFSPALQQLMPDAIAPNGLNFLTGVMVHAHWNDEQFSILQATLASILGEDSLAWDLNHGNLPREVTWKNDRIVTIDWSPIFGAGSRVQALLVSLRDVTERRQLEAQVQSQKLQGEKLLAKLIELQQSPRSLVLAFLKNTQEWLAAVGPASGWARILHTLKGEARGLGLKGLSQSIHSAETQMRGEPISSDQLFQGLALEVQHYALLAQGNTSQHPAESGTQNLFDLVSQRLPDLKQLLQSHRLRAGRVQVEDGFQDWTPALVERVRPMLLHGLTNAIDHGFMRSPTPSPVHLQIDFEDRGSSWVLNIRDSGQGLNWDRIKILAAQVGFTPGPDQTLADCLFVEGLTTAEQLSETSGRGVGLHVIAEICREVGGTASLRDNDRGRGAWLRIEWPQATATLSKIA